MRKVLVSIVAVVSLLTTACNAGPQVGEPGGPSAYDPGDRQTDRPEELPPGVIVLPKCEEDEPYLLGKGDWDGRQWSRYVCIHSDSIKRVTP